MQTEIARIADATRSGNHELAATLADRAIAAGLRHPLPFHIRAIARDRQGRADEALADYEQARALAPRDIGILNTLGLCLMRLGRFREAKAALLDAIAIAPGHAQSRSNLGLIENAAGRIVDATAAFEQVAALEPRHREALGRLALLAAHRGDWPNARLWGDRALAADPRSPNGLRALAEAEMGDLRWSDAEARIRAWLSSPDLGPNERHHALGLLGDALDGQDRMDEAFAAYAESNAVMRRAHAARFDGSAGPTVPATLLWLRETFERLPPIGPAPPAGKLGQSPARGHVFLVGFMRSGTTLLEQALANHDDVVALEEYEALADSTRAFLSAPAGIADLARIDGAAADRHRNAYWRQVQAACVEPDGKVLLDKHPFNAVKLPLVARLFPDAKVIFALRDPRDVILSCFRHRLRISPFTFEMLDLVAAAKLYDSYMSLVERYRATLELDILDHRHEALIADFDGALKPICDRIGLAWTDALRDVGARVRQGLTVSQSAAKVRAGVNASGLAQWRRYEAQLRPALPYLTRWIERFGYDAS